MGLYPAAACGTSPVTADAAVARRGYPSGVSDAEWSLIEPAVASAG